MKKLLATVFALILVSAAAIPVFAAPERILTRELMEKFLRDFPLVQAEMEALDAELSEELEAFEMDDSGLPSLESIQAGIMAIMMNPKVMAILARYGWTEAFMQTYIAVMTGYTYIAFEEIFLTYPLPQIKEILDQFRTGLHPDDLALLKQYRSRIEAVLDIDLGL